MMTGSELINKSNKLSTQTSIQQQGTPTRAANDLSDSFGLPQIEATYDQVFKQITKLEDGDIIRRANCKFCNHPIRAEAEKKYEQGNRTSYTLVFKFFKNWEAKNPDNGVLPMNMVNVRTHLLNHYLQQERRIQMREYGDNLKEIMNYKINQDQRFDMLRSSLELKILEIASSQSLDPMKQADTMAKLTKAICDIEITRGKLKSQLDAEQAMLEKCANAWSYAIRLTDHPETKRMLIDAMESFEASLEGVILPESVK